MDAPTTTAWEPVVPRLRPARLVISWLISTVALLGAAAVMPKVEVDDWRLAAATAALLSVLNAIAPPLAAALRLPFTVAIGFILVLIVDAQLLIWASRAVGGIVTTSLPAALAVTIVAAGLTTALSVALGTDDDDEYTYRVTRRIARRTGGGEATDVPGIVYLEIDGLALPVLQRALRDGNAPTMSRWLRDGSHRLLEWETDLSSQTGASQAGILLGSNDDIPAFRWVEKATGRTIACSAPGDCAELERRLATGRGLLVNGGTSRGNLLSGEADAAILTVSRLAEERRPNPGYRAFLANGSNVSRTLALFAYEVVLEVIAARRAVRRDVQPRGHRGGIYPLLRGAMCVVVRDLIVHATITDMMAGRPAVYATFSSYDEVAHHSGLERADTLEALRKLDRQIGRIERARRYAARPYELVVLSDHGQTQGATFRQRNGYGLDELVQGALDGAAVRAVAGGDEHETAVGAAVGEATGTGARRASTAHREEGAGPADASAIVLGSGNLGLVYLMEEPRRLTLEEIAARHPRLVETLVAHPHVGWVLARSEVDGPVVLGRGGRRLLATGAVEGDDPLAVFGPGAAGHLLRTDGFPSVADLMIGSFYDPELDEGCAFEELISFHGGLGGPQTRPFILAPAHLPAPEVPLDGAAAVHGLLAGWRNHLQGDGVVPA